MPAESRLFMGSLENAFNNASATYDQRALTWLSSPEYPWDEKLRRYIENATRGQMKDFHVIQELKLAAEEKKLVLVRTLGGSAVGYLQDKTPWSVEIDEHPVTGVRTPELCAHFERGKRIDGVREVAGSHEDQSSRWIDGPDVRDLENDAMVVNLERDWGVEGFARRLIGNVSHSVFVGVRPIRHGIDTMQLSSARREAMHDAFIMAVGALGIEP